MSMHKKPLTPLEEEGLRKHGLAIGTPSQLSDVFRHGVAWALSQQAAQPVAQGPRVCWLVEEFSDTGNSTGRYMQDQSGLTITTDVQNARQFRGSRTATFRATDMREKWGTAWRPVSHVFRVAQPQQATTCTDPHCPCRDGDTCHYKDGADGTKAWAAQPVAWADDGALAGGVGSVASAATKQYWTRGDRVDRETAARLKHPLYAAAQPQQAEPAELLREALAGIEYLTAASSTVVGIQCGYELQNKLRAALGMPTVAEQQDLDDKQREEDAG